MKASYRNRGAPASFVGSLAIILTIVYATPAASTTQVITDSSVVQDNGPDFIVEIRGLLPTQFGGGWIASTESGDVLHLGLTDTSATILNTVQATAEQFGLENSLVIDLVPYSATQLEAFYDELASKSVDWSADDLAQFGVRADLDKIEVVLTQDDPALVDLILGVVPNDALQVTVDPEAKFVG